MYDLLEKEGLSEEEIMKYLSKCKVKYAYIDTKK